MRSFLGAAVLVVLGWTSAASACECGHQTIHPEDLVFIGVVKSSVIERVTSEGSVPRRVRRVCLDVEQSLQGRSRGQVCVSTGLGGPDCGVPFVVGVRYQVQAHPLEDWRFPTGLETSRCDETDRVRELFGQGWMEHQIVSNLYLFGFTLFALSLIGVAIAATQWSTGAMRRRRP